jgi:hypothetical protein
MTLDRSNPATLGMLGLLSGGVAWGLIMLTALLPSGTEVGADALRVVPGLAFGLIVGSLWRRRGMASRGVVLGYTLASGLAYFVAEQFALDMYDRLSGILPGDWRLALDGILAGLVGSCLLGLATVPLLRVPYPSALGWPVFAGGAAGAVLPLINLFEGWAGGYLLFFVVWQGAYAASLARLQPGFVPADKAASVG